MEVVEDAPPVLDPALSLLTDVRDRGSLEQRRRKADGTEVERFDIAVEILEAFDRIERLTGLDRSAVSALLGCRSPDPETWLDVDPSELGHSLSAVRCVADEIDNAAHSSALSERVRQLRTIAPSLVEKDAEQLASIQSGRAAAEVCADLLRRAHGSTLAVRRAFAEQDLPELIAADRIGEARAAGASYLQPRRRFAMLLGQSRALTSEVDLDDVVDDGTSIEDFVDAAFSAVSKTVD